MESVSGYRHEAEFPLSSSRQSQGVLDIDDEALYDINNNNNNKNGNL